MYTIHVKIKDICKHNGDIAQTLDLISNYKKIFQARINSINYKMSLWKDTASAEHFEAQALDFYEGLIEKIDSINEEPEAKSIFNFI